MASRRSQADPRRSSNIDDDTSSAREIETVPNFFASATPAKSHAHIDVQRARVASVRSNVSGGGSGKGRESFSATLWETMKEDEKYAFNKKRLLQLFSGVLIATCGGSSFAFGIFSNKIKASAHFTQSDMTTITTTASILSSFTFPAGILFDHYGPQYVLLCATILCCTGFSLLALIFEGRVEATVYSVSAANAISSLGVGFTDGGSLLTNLFNFPINRGEVLIIQKTFFGLGATFLSLVFDGFFSQSDNYLGYAITVTVMMFGAGVFGTLVFRLPPYKRTNYDLKRIAKLDPVEQEAEREFEEQQFALYHNPRLVDRRRLNAGVTCLLFSLAFFSSFSVVKAYVTIPSDVITGLTVTACLCMASFLIMLAPFKLPKFFDYEFLPDLHPPEALVDKPEDDDNNDKKKDTDTSEKATGINDGNASFPSAVDSGNNKSSEKAPLLGGAACDFKNVKAVEYGVDTEEEESAKQKSEGANGGRASAFHDSRASIAGNSAPIAVPRAIAPSVVPSITTPFTTSILRPMLWALWFMAFCISAVSVIISNQAQIMTAANGGVFDKRSNSLAVALMGIGSASGRIIIGFLETYFQRRNALAREEQLLWEAEHGPAPSRGAAGEDTVEDPSSFHAEGQPDMRPVYHRLTSSIVCLIPVCPAVLTLCSFLFTVAPISAFPAIFVFLSTAYGAWIALLALTVREVFSVDVAKHFNFIFTSGIAAALLLNRLMFGTWFDQEAELHPAADGVSCDGYSCFARSLYVIGSLCGFAVLTTSYIVWNWWTVRKTF